MLIQREFSPQRALNLVLFTPDGNNVTHEKLYKRCVQYSCHSCFKGIINQEVDPPYEGDVERPR